MEKKENKTMKKGLTIAALALLLGIVGYTGGNTFAKYVSQHDAGSVTATVAKWGFTATGNVENLFGSNYQKPNADKLASVTKTTDGLVVKALGSGNVVAPGTQGSMTLEVLGDAEVDAKISFESTYTDIALGDYHPIQWTVTRNGVATSVTNSKGADMAKYFKELSFEYEAGSSAIDEEFVISWKWEFHVDKATDDKDTQLGQQVPLQQMSFDLLVKFEQIQNPAAPQTSA